MLEEERSLRGCRSRSLKSLHANTDLPLSARFRLATWAPSGVVERTSQAASGCGKGKVRSHSICAPPSQPLLHEDLGSPGTPSTAAASEEDSLRRNLPPHGRHARRSSLIGIEDSPLYQEMLPLSAADPMLRAKFVGAFLTLAKLPVSQEVTASILSTLVLFRRMNYDDTDILSVMSHASAYSACIQQRSLGTSAGELGSLLVVCIYAAHGWVMDLHCPARVWFADVLERRCSIKAFNKAIMHLMRLRGYRLRITPRSLSERFNNLKSAIT